LRCCGYHAAFSIFSQAKKPANGGFDDHRAGGKRPQDAHFDGCGTVSRDTLNVLLLVGILLWGIALLTGSMILGFVGLAFANEPGSGSTVTGSEYLVAAAPAVISALLTIGLFMLWQKGFFKIALAVWLLSVLAIGPIAYGYVF
jgi:hypothetical protein